MVPKLVLCAMTIPEKPDKQVQVSVIFPENTVSVAATRANSQFLTMRGWNVQLVTFEDASVASVAIQLGWILLRPVLMLIVVWLIRKILISIMAGAPFYDRAPGHLKAIGWLIIAASVGRTLEDFFVGLYVKNHYALSKWIFAASFDYSSMLWGSAIGVMVMILAGVFRYGRAIRQEQELTV